LKEPKVTLTKGSETINLNVHFEFPPIRELGVQIKAIVGELQTWAKLRFEVATASFFVDEAEVEDLDIEKIPGIGDKFIIAYVNHKLPTWLKEKGPVFQLKGSFNNNLGRCLLQEMRIRDGILVLKLGVGEASPEATPAAPAEPKKQVPVEDPDIQVWMAPPI